MGRSPRPKRAEGHTGPFWSLAARADIGHNPHMSRGHRHGLNGLSQSLAVLALLAVMVRAMIPAGYMVAPSRSSDATAIIMLCTGQGSVATRVDLATGEVLTGAETPSGKSDAPAKSPGNHAPCIFAAAAPLASPEVAVAVQVPVQVETASRANTGVVTPGRGLAAPPPWSTGPPATA